MARQARLDAPGTLHHVMVRGTLITPGSSFTISIRLPESLLEAVKSLPTREMFPISRG